jgi:hypothetical protein
MVTAARNMIKKDVQDTQDKNILRILHILFYHVSLVYF